ncbi:MAG: lipid A deacylase LpxR family protein [Gemmatimonadota bacterium]|nr:lipid A deacylase LpxR family protein [Gemmatimonadota bacterium]
MKPSLAGSRYTGLLAVFFAMAVPTSAQTLSGVTFQVDNDYFDFWMPGRERPDDNYTHGQLLRTVFNVAPAWMRRGVPSCGESLVSSTSPNRCVQSFLTISQEIFTPTHDTPTPVVGERPYAGLLYADLGRSIVDRRQSRSLAIRIGTTGHPSGAEAAQTLFHRLLDQRHPKGWDYQIGAEPVIGITYGRQYLMTPGLATRRVALQVIGTGRTMASHVQANLSAGVEMRAGYRVPHPWIPAADTDRRGLRFFVLLGGSEKWVARDLLLEGNTKWTHGLVTKRPFVFESTWGLGAGVGSYAVEYRAVSRSRDYLTGPSWHRWGSISLVHGNL